MCVYVMNVCVCVCDECVCVINVPVMRRSALCHFDASHSVRMTPADRELLSDWLRHDRVRVMLMAVFPSLPPPPP